VGTGAHPRAEAAFGPAAEAYEAGRPGWPVAALAVVDERLGLTGDSRVLDLAAGTGKLTRDLVGRYAAVYAVEPVDGMRAVLERTTPGATVLAGTAEAIPLEDGAVDAVFVAEAIHWFRIDAALAEIRRVGSGLAVLFNRFDWRTSGDPLLADLHDAFARHHDPNPAANDPHQGPWREAIEGATRDEVPNRVTRTGDQLVRQYESFSSIGSLDPEPRAAALADLRGVIDRHAVREVEITYTTEILTLRP
jgi:SAM-dependent methyltransferase